MARRRPLVVAIGDAIVDVVTPPMPSLGAGDAQREVARVDLLPGGNATNFVLAAAALGARAAFVGRVGRDPLGAVLRSAYREYGVAARLRVDGTRPTGTTVALTWADGTRALVTSLGANANLRESDVPSGIIERADHVHRAGFWWTAQLQGAPTVRLLARAQRSGAATSLDIATDPHGWKETRVAAVRACLPHVDTFFGNETEICAIAGAPDPVSAARELCRLGAGEVVVHRGERGSSWIRGERSVTEPAFRVSEENPTGCGDVFNAGYVSSRFRGDDVRDALRFANGCAALHLSDRTEPYPSARAAARLLRDARRRSRR